ncbi:glycoside hydrolase family 5 protein [Aplosporella prunicola CBS 121167]|uniref:glucan 1,3-beta-glucosidase n=1 Tax=Aplosporella prunicola CBS 121167 TaxID=1176127 RepID=A0A6A6BAJ7_9PEZI|nr:glycoside hydrolase family 5 protein [Aplosporella prunicola CBS 121167]KAF2140295.1 glycoside hydrolase family 5 protein [Aplosporella prunicola CBS 121167]
MLAYLFFALGLPALAWLPASPPGGVSLQAFTSSKTSKIRGVNLGSQFLIEPWMSRQAWADIGCTGAEAEFQCVKNNFGGDINRASAAFQRHWASWITRNDINKMLSYGLNTIRIPLGWWMKEDLVKSGEYFPKGGFTHLENICRWATDAGMYIIIDLHGVPGTQLERQPFTGNSSDRAYFYQSDYQSGRSYEFLSWMTQQILINPVFKNVGAIGVINEPKFNTIDGDTKWMVEHYYGSAIDSIRNVEASRGVSGNSRLHIMLMDDLWGSGSRDPTSSLTAGQKSFLLFDDHNYQEGPTSGKDAAGIIAYACGDNRVTALEPGNTKVVGEFAMALSQSSGLRPETNYKSFYQSYFAAQQWQYEKTNGWVFWTWKTDQRDLGNWLQWSYSGAVENGLISTNLNAQLAANPCQK